MISSDSRNPILDRVPERYRAASLTDLSCDVRDAIAAAEKRGVAFLGETGRGKTHAMAAIANVAGGHGWIDWAEFCSDIRKHWTFKNPDDMRWFDPIRWAVRIPMLYVDDLGAEKDTQSADAFERVVKGRNDAGRALCLTTNLTHEEIGVRYGGRTQSRLNEMCDFIALGGVDRRIGVLQ